MPGLFIDFASDREIAKSYSRETARYLIFISSIMASYAGLGL
jgi:hypothetical protein